MTSMMELATAAWRLEKWLNNLKSERKMAAKSALRIIKKFLEENEIEIEDLTGRKFDVGLAISVINNESNQKTEDNLVISEMIKPIIKEKGTIVQYGQVIVGDKLKEMNSMKITNGQLQHNTQNKKAKNKFTRKIKYIIFFQLQLILMVYVWKINYKVNGIVTNNQTIEQQAGVKEELVRISGTLRQICQIQIKLDNTLKQSCLDALSKVVVQEKSKYVRYIVKPNDTLIGICKSKKISYYKNEKKILKVNGIKNPALIKVGQKILIPITVKER